MALIDDLKKGAEEGLRTLKHTAEEIAFSVEKQAKIARKKMEIMKIQRRVQKLYAEVGEYVYGEFALERPLNIESPFVKERLSSIKDLKEEISEIEQEIDETKQMQPSNPTDYDVIKREREE
jgi:cell shape-determining protein MreC